MSQSGSGSEKHTMNKDKEASQHLLPTHHTGYACLWQVRLVYMYNNLKNQTEVNLL